MVAAAQRRAGAAVAASSPAVSVASPVNAAFPLRRCAAMQVHSLMIKKTSAVTTTVLGEVKIVGLLVMSAMLLGECNASRHCQARMVGCLARMQPCKLAGGAAWCGVQMTVRCAHTDLHWSSNSAASHALSSCARLQGRAASSRSR